MRAFDNAGNENSTSVSFLIDTVAPTISITSPANGSYINTQSAELMWSGYDLIGHRLLFVYLNGDQVANTTECHCELTGLLDGTYTAQVKAFDMAGNENDKVGFTMSTGPVVSIDSPVTISTPTTMWAVYYTNESSLTMTGSVTEIAPLSSANITLYLNGTQVYRGKITDLSTLYDLDQRYTLFVGNDKFVMMINDSAGNSVVVRLTSIYSTGASVTVSPVSPIYTNVNETNVTIGATGLTPLVSGYFDHYVNGVLVEERVIDDIP